MKKVFPVRAKSGNFEQTGKVRGFLPKILENEGIFTKLLEKWGHFSQILFIIEVYLFNRFLYLLNSLNETLKKYWKWKENTGIVREKLGKFGSLKMWEPWQCRIVC